MIKRKVTLCYPPCSSVWHLPAGIAQLAAILQEQGHEVIQRYGHILGLEYLLLSHDREKVSKALSTVRDPKSDVKSLYQARMTFERVSLAIPNNDKKFVVERNNVVFVSGYYDGTVESAMEAIRNREDHLWFDYFRDVELPAAEDFYPEVFGISISDERQLIQGLILASMVKDALPECLVIIGGNFWSRVVTEESAPKLAPLLNICDAIVYAEGFQPLSTIVETLDVGSAPGTMWKDKDGNVRLNRLPMVLTSFETLPTPIYDGGATQWASDAVYPLYTMSNCIHKCEFCAISGQSDSFLGKPRVMTPERIVEHMITLGGYWFDFTDELMPVQRQIGIGDELRRRGYEAVWQCYLTITDDLLDPRVCQQLYEAGCRCVQLGLETLTPTTLDQTSKRWNHPQNYGRILRNLKEAGIQNHIFLIAGIPGERQSDTLRWLPFLEEYGDAITTIKSGRYRLARRSPDETVMGLSSESEIERWLLKQPEKSRESRRQHVELLHRTIRMLPDTLPLHLNREFEYDGDERSVRKDVEALRDILEQACRENPYYRATSTIPWWINRRSFTWDQLAEANRQLPNEEPAPHLDRALNRIGGIVRHELGREETFRNYHDAMEFARTL